MGVTELTNLTYEALQRYFTRLSLAGYVNYSDVNTLLVLAYILEIMTNYVLSLDELRVINNAVSCLLNSNCMITSVGCKGACF